MEEIRTEAKILHDFCNSAGIRYRYDPYKSVFTQKNNGLGTWVWLYDEDGEKMRYWIRNVEQLWKLLETKTARRPIK